MHVTVLDNVERVIGTAVSGAGGAFVVEGLPAGTYRLAASDEIGSDFATGWHGGMSFENADTIKVKQGKTRRKAGVTLVSAAEIEPDIDVRRHEGGRRDHRDRPRLGRTRGGLSAHLDQAVQHRAAADERAHGDHSFRLGQGLSGTQQEGQGRLLRSKHTRPASATGKLR